VVAPETAALKPYSTYKDSGVPWLGQVPEQWDIKRNKLFLREVNQRSEDGTEELLTVSQFTGVTRRRERSPGEGDLLTHATSLVGHKRVSPGDLVVNIMLAWKGSLGVSSLAGIVSPAYCVYRAGPQSEPRFLHYLYRTPLFTGAFKTVSTGVMDSRLRLYPDVFFGMSSLLPPLPEQMSIVRYLDHMDRKVRHAIRARQQLIKLLTEQKQAIIQRAVTRGLDPNVRLKRSGVPGLADVPEHWEVSPWRRLFDDVYRYPTYYDIKYVESGIPEVRGEALVDGNIVELPDQRYIAQDTNKAFPRTILREGDIVMSVRGTMGKIGVVGEKHVGANITANLLRLSPRREIMHSYYLSWLLRSHGFLYELERVSPQTTIKTVTMSQLGGLRLCVPPLSEQPAIVQYLDGAMANLNKAIDAAHREIDLLREYRTRLIADVVTGKLDVRGVKVPDDETDVLPEELENIDDVETTDESDDAAEGNSESGSEENT
jgi:type I restriction enzyme S subunit